MPVVWYHLDKTDLYLAETNTFWMFFRLIKLVYLPVDLKDQILHSLIFFFPESTRSSEYKFAKVFFLRIYLYFLLICNSSFNTLYCYVTFFLYPDINKSSIPILKKLSKFSFISTFLCQFTLNSLGCLSVFQIFVLWWNYEMHIIFFQYMN